MSFSILGSQDRIVSVPEELTEEGNSKRACALDLPRSASGPLPRIPQGLGGAVGPLWARFAVLRQTE